ncbi:MAG: glycosyl transferase, partial [Gammaproteobacteria bacterium]|nr:glycosyl transferase [Gammaproteobacteria bacterium]
VRLMREQPQVGVVGCQVEQFPAPTRGAELYLEWQNACITPAQIAADIYVEAPFAHPSVMLRRTVLQSHDGYREGDFPEDYDLWLRLHAAGVQMAKVPQVLLRWRDTPGRLTRTDSRYNREAFDRLRAGYLADDPRFRSNASRFVICGAGRRTRQRCRHLLNKGFTPVAWVDIDPRKIGNRLSGVPVVAPQWLEDNRCFALGYVAVHGGRERLARQLDGFGYRRGHDYLLVG